MNMRTIIPGTLETRDLHQYLLGCVAPRPIAFVSTVDENGHKNLAPYSFFNAFSSNPPIVVFSSNRKVADNTTKDTLHNIRTTGEAVINMVNYDIVRQMAVTSISFDSGISEFEKSGLTAIPGQKVKAFRVEESPAHLEVKVQDIITLGEHGGAGHLIICRVEQIHIRESVIEKGRINPHKIDLMGRMGRAYYCRASGDAIHTIVQPVMKISIGYNALPDSIKYSQVLNGNDIGLLAGLEQAPKPAEIAEVRHSPKVQASMQSEDPATALHHLSKLYLRDDKDRKRAAAILWLADEM
jgi:flavin reductase (DIM6/NTAB) family NADH-FMN oxidoreductase RutF